MMRWLMWLALPLGLVCTTCLASTILPAVTAATLAAWPPQDAPATEDDTDWGYDQPADPDDAAEPDEPPAEDPRDDPAEPADDEDSVEEESEEESDDEAVDEESVEELADEEQAEDDAEDETEPAPADEAQDDADPDDRPEVPADKAVTRRPDGAVFVGTTQVIDPSRVPQGLEGVGLTGEQVNQAIARGRLWLWNELQKQIRGREEGLHHGKHLLACLALLHADGLSEIPEFDPLVRSFLASLDLAGRQIYEQGLVPMVLEGVGDPTFDYRMRQALRYLIEAQGPEGSWDYNPADDGAVMALVNLEQPQGPAPGEGYWQRRTDWAVGEDGDNSVSQFAVLGVWTADRWGFKVPRELWQRSLRSFQQGQCDDGGWAYQPHGRRGYGSMTCAGICSIALALHHLGNEPLTDPGVLRGLAWLVRHWSIEGNPEHGNTHHYYYLYSLERVGQILGIEFIGPHEWYPLGARHLVDAQQPDGSWDSHDGQLESTCYALLFLTRATPSAAPPTGPGTLRTMIASQLGGRVYIILDASGSMLAPAGASGTKFDVARAGVLALLEALPAQTQVALRVYGHRRTALDAQADTDTALEVPMAPLDLPAMRSRLMALRARGKTPLARSLEQARADLEALAPRPSQPITVVLLTDGGEDTAQRRDPVAEAARLAGLDGVNLRIIGFDVERPDWTRQMQAMARSAGGTYLPVALSADLVAEMRGTARPTLPQGFTVIDAQGQTVASGTPGQDLPLPAGTYQLSLSHRGQTLTMPITIAPGRVTHLRIDLPEATADEPSVPAPSVEPTPAGPAKFCTQCGQRLSPSARFCTGCGAAVKNR